MPVGLKKRLPKAIVIVPVNKKKSAEINRRYRGKNKPANILSFSYGRDYGEILICPALIRREAKEQGHSYRFQRTWMILHGLLHLAGLDHEKSSKERKRFEKLENRLLKTINYKLLATS